MLIGTYPIKIILAGGIFGFIIITTAFKTIKGKITKKDMFCELKISFENRSTFVKAIIDTGNFLKEPISKAPVIVVEKGELYEVIPNKILNNLNEIINGEKIEIDEYMAKIRIIPFSSLGKENGILLGMKADTIKINFDGKEINIENAIIGIYDGHLNNFGKYNALIGLELLEYEGGKENESIRTIKI